jgi:hypothetical protein
VPYPSFFANLRVCTCIPQTNDLTELDMTGGKQLVSLEMNPKPAPKQMGSLALF